jgi:hypothetical protein
MISNKEYTALIIVSVSWVYFVGANLVFALSIGRIQDSPLLLPDGGDTRINVWTRNPCYRYTRNEKPAMVKKW